MSAALPRLADAARSGAPLDRVEWTAGLCGTTFGVRVGVRVDRADLLPKVAAHLPLDWQDSASPVVDYLYSVCGGDQIPGTRIRRFFMGFSSSRNFVRTLHEQEALAALESAIYEDVAVATRRYAFVHAGVVGWRGRAILAPGVSRSGKSQLVLALLRAGATYYSDDMAAIDESGCVHRVSRTIGLRDENGVSRAVRLDSLGASQGDMPLPIGAVVSTRFSRGATWQPRKGSAAEALLALLPHTARTRVAPGDTMQILARAVQGAVFLESPRDDADVAVRELLRALDGAG